MPEITVVLYDNTLSSQNQDYLPGRIILQKEIIDSIITQILETDGESLVGLIPLAQEQTNNILTPTKQRPYLSTFLHHSDLCYNANHYRSLYQADQSLHVNDLSTKNLYIFLSSPVKNVEELLSSLYTLASKGITIKTVCFGDSVELGRMLKNEIDFDNFDCLVLENDVNFNEHAFKFLVGSAQPMDPNLEEAIRRSMQEQ